MGTSVTLLKQAIPFFLHFQQKHTAVLSTQMNNNGNCNRKRSSREMEGVSQRETKRRRLNGNSPSRCGVSGDTGNRMESLMNKLHQLSEESNIEFASESDDKLNPICLQNVDQIIVPKSSILSSIRSASCPISGVPALCDICAGFLVDDTVFSTKQFLSMLIDERHSKSMKNVLSDFNMGLSIWSDRPENEGGNEQKKKNIKEFMISKQVIDLVDHHRVPLTIEAAKKMSGIDEEQMENATWEWVEFMNQKFADCSIIRVPSDIFMEDGIEAPSNYQWNCHQNFILGRTTQGDLIGFCGFVVWT